MAKVKRREAKKVEPKKVSKSEAESAPEKKSEKKTGNWPEVEATIMALTMPEGVTLGVNTKKKSFTVTGASLTSAKDGSAAVWRRLAAMRTEGKLESFPDVEMSVA